MPDIRSGDGSNTPVTAVTDLLAQHFAGETPVETPQEEEAETLEASEQETYQSEEPVEGESPEAGEEEGQEPVVASDDGEINTFTEFAEALELDPSVLYGLTYALPDGMEPVTLSEMKDAYVKSKREGDAPNEAANALMAERQQFEQEKAYAMQQMQMQSQIPDHLRQLQNQWQNIQSVEANTNWDELEKVDPADASLQLQKLTRAKEDLKQQYAQAEGAWNQQMNQQAQMNQYQEVEFAQAQIAELEKAHPEWKGNIKAIETAWDDVLAYAEGFGLTKADMQQMPNGKIFNMLHAAASGSKGGKGKRLTRRSAPALRAGAIRAAMKGKSTKLDSIIKRGTNSSDIRDQTAAVSALLNS